MLIAGLTINQTRGDLDLLDGNVCLADSDNIIAAIAEERLSRVKYDGHIRRSFNYCLSAAGVSPLDVDCFVASTCCDTAPPKHHAMRVLKSQHIAIPDEKLTICPSHHLSHACSAFFTSSFDRALVVVADNEGNILNEESPHYPYFEQPLEKLSIYIGEGRCLRLLRRMYCGAGDLGLGNLYAYFTEYLGHSSYQLAGKVTGLAPYGSIERFRHLNAFVGPWTDRRSLVEPLYNRRLAVRRFLLKGLGEDLGYPSEHSTAHPEQIHMDLAALVQRVLEEELMGIVGESLQETGLRNLCLSGGVFLNCLANGKLTQLADNVHVACAPGDTGQGIGNVLWYANIGSPEATETRITFPGFGGICYDAAAIERVLQKESQKIQYAHASSPAEQAAIDLSNGRTVFWFQGPSELGPRALGNRSILAHPGRAGTRDYINSVIKRREWYRPFAPAVLKHKSNEIFGINSSPYMHIALPVNPLWRERLSEIVHVNGTARVQTVSREANALFFDLISHFEELTGLPVVLNTSFNGPGEPIVETPADAVATFLASGDDVLYLGSFKAWRRNP